jgi:hypothetical protein
MIGGIEETSASSEARSAPRSYPTDGVVGVVEEAMHPIGVVLIGPDNLS